MKFHIYLKELRKRRYADTNKLCMMLGVSKDLWRKLERGINPPPKKSVLKKFCLLVNILSYEQSQLFELARRWEPHKDTNSACHNLINKNSSPEWIEAMIKENKPDYAHKYWGKSYRPT
jgi:transcriptional regulator with XRE-family HTH domain